jgi:glucoamylase
MSRWRQKDQNNATELQARRMRDLQGRGYPTEWIAMELAEWINAQSRFSAEKIQAAISATTLKRVREPLGQTVIPARGSVLASPIVADWDPEPDYFFHWMRDSAIVMRTVAELATIGSEEKDRRRWTECFEDFVRFSLELTRIDCRSVLQNGSPRARTRAEFQKFVRDDAEFAALFGDRLLAEPRFNADGTVDVLRWSRPQYDGPALRALTCLRYVALGGIATPELKTLLDCDLSFTLRHSAQPCIGPWEEPDENIHHYYVAVVQLGALVHGREWLEPEARAEAETRLRAILEQHWSTADQVYSAIYPYEKRGRDNIIDSACLIAVVDADLPSGRHSVGDARVWQTMQALEELFAREFPINVGRAAPALGRSRADRYFGGGAWYVATLAAASLCYRRAATDPNANRFIQRGDAFMETIRNLSPISGCLSEQVDRTSGMPTSARDLTWSYSAFVHAAQLRNRLAL